MFPEHFSLKPNHCCSPIPRSGWTLTTFHQSSTRRSMTDRSAFSLFQMKTYLAAGSCPCCDASMNNRDIVILFGAGASYGPGHVLPQAPPLGVNLYDALAAQYPKDWGSESHLGKMWASQLRDDFERTMYEEVLPKVSSLPLLEWHRRVAEFFATYRVDGSGQDMYS